MLKVGSEAPAMTTHRLLPGMCLEKSAHRRLMAGFAWNEPPVGGFRRLIKAVIWHSDVPELQVKVARMLAIRR